jgi:hypothetical protein
MILGSANSVDDDLKAQQSNYPQRSPPLRGVSNQSRYRCEA